MRGDDEVWVQGVAGTIAEHVAGAIDADVLQAELRERRAAALRRAPLP